MYCYNWWVISCLDQSTITTIWFSASSGQTCISVVLKHFQEHRWKQLDCSNDPETLHMFSNHRIVSVLRSLFPTLLSFSTYKKTPLNPCKLTAFFFFNDFIHHFVKQMLNVTNPFSCHSNDLLLNLTLEEVQLTLSFHHYPAFLQKLGSVT